MIHIHRLAMLSYGAIACYSPCRFSFTIFPCQFLPFLKSLLLTWNPSFCVVRSCPRSPFPPHSLPIPNSHPLRASPVIVRLTKTTSRSRLCVVRNTPLVMSSLLALTSISLRSSLACGVLCPCSPSSWLSTYQTPRTSSTRSRTRPPSCR